MIEMSMISNSNVLKYSIDNEVSSVNIIWNLDY
jgi:hypothetical protein